MKQDLKKQIQAYLENPGKEREAPMEELLEVWLAMEDNPPEELEGKNRLLREIRRRTAPEGVDVTRAVYDPEPVTFRVDLRDPEVLAWKGLEELLAALEQLRDLPGEDGEAFRQLIREEILRRCPYGVPLWEGGREVEASLSRIREEAEEWMLRDAWRDPGLTLQQRERLVVLCARYRKYAFQSWVLDGCREETRLLGTGAADRLRDPEKNCRRFSLPGLCRIWEKLSVLPRFEEGMLKKWLTEILELRCPHGFLLWQERGLGPEALESCLVPEPEGEYTLGQLLDAWKEGLRPRWLFEEILARNPMGLSQWKEHSGQEHCLREYLLLRYQPLEGCSLEELLTAWELRRPWPYERMETIYRTSWLLAGEYAIGARLELEIRRRMPDGVRQYNDTPRKERRPLREYVTFAPERLGWYSTAQLMGFWEKEEALREQLAPELQRRRPRAWEHWEKGRQGTYGDLRFLMTANELEPCLLVTLPVTALLDGWDAMEDGDRMAGKFLDEINRRSWDGYSDWQWEQENEDWMEDRLNLRSLRCYVMAAMAREEGPFRFSLEELRVAWDTLLQAEEAYGSELSCREALWEALAAYGDAALSEELSRERRMAFLKTRLESVSRVSAVTEESSPRDGLPEELHSPELLRFQVSWDWGPDPGGFLAVFREEADARRRLARMEQKQKEGKLGRDWAMPELCQTPVGPAILLLKYCYQSSTLWDTAREIGQMLSWGEILRQDPRVEAELEYWLTWKPEEE